MPKKGNNEGSIRKRSDGTWEARYTAGRNADGKQIQRSIYGKTRTEVAKKLADVLGKLNAGEYIAPNKLTLGEWLKIWLRDYASVYIRPSTYISYEGYIYNHIDPVIGGVLLQELTTERLQAFYLDRIENGRVDGKGGLSAKMLTNIHNMLHKGLSQAAKNGIISKNVSEHTVLPKRQRKEMRVLSTMEQFKLHNVLDTERLGFAVLLDLATGLRIGELCALRWQDIDFEQNAINVRNTAQRLKTSQAEREAGVTENTRIHIGEVKTEKGKRTIPLHDIIWKELLEHQVKQRGEKFIAAGAYTDEDFIFASPLGGVVEPSTMRDMYKRLLNRSAIKNATFHTLRHTFATRAIESGVPIKTVSDILGHATVQLTMDLYCHSSLDLKRDAMEKMSKLWDRGL